MLFPTQIRSENNNFKMKANATITNYLTYTKGHKMLGKIQPFIFYQLSFMGLKFFPIIVKKY